MPWLLLALGGQSSGQSLVTIKSVETKPPKGAAEGLAQFFVAPELTVAREAEADLVGFDKAGGLVVSADPDAIAGMARREDVKSLERREAEEVTAPIRLMVGYRQGNADAVKNSLTQAGYRIVKHSKRARYFVVTGKAEPAEDDDADGGIDATDGGIDATDGRIDAAMVNALFGPVQASGASSATPNYQLRIPEPKAPRGAAHRPDETETVRPSETTPNDPLFDELWGMRQIEAPSAWDVVTGSQTVVAVIDTGVDIDHPDLQGNIWENEAELNGEAGVDDDGNGYVDDTHGWDFYNDDNSVYDSAEDNHGTHVAGTIGAVQNDVGVVGVSWQIKLMPVKFLGSGGGTLDDAIDAIYYAADNGAQILSNSWGGGGYNPIMEQAIESAGLFVAAAGNDGEDNDSVPHYPSSYDVANVIAVASIDETEEMSWFSNYGSQSVDLAAPGGLIMSTLPEEQYGVLSGTSMATPHVSGALALMLACDSWRGAPASLVKQTLLDESRTLAQLEGKCVTGGTLNISFLAGDCSETPEPSPGQPSVVIASVSFSAGDRTITTDGSLLAELNLELTSAADIVIVGNTSGNASEDSRIDTAVAVHSKPEHPAYRYVTCPQSVWTGITITHGLRLPAGNHRITWDAFSDSGEVKLDDGAITVVARSVDPPSGETRQRRHSIEAASRTQGTRDDADEETILRRERPGATPVRSRDPAAADAEQERQQRQSRRLDLRERLRRTLEEMPRVK